MKNKKSNDDQCVNKENVLCKSYTDNLKRIIKSCKKRKSVFDALEEMGVLIRIKKDEK